MATVQRKVAEGPKDKYGPCPCSSGLAQVKCCKSSGSWIRTPAITEPRGQRTNAQTLKCYAAALGDCAGGISREHYLSDTLLQELGDPVGIQGFPWQTTDGVEPFSIASMTAKVLCARHNSALSELDTRSAELFRTVRGMEQSLSGGRATSNSFAVFSGEDLERWVLKVLCGMTVAGLNSNNNASLGKRSIPLKWLELLFSNDTWPTGWGVYFGTQFGSGFHARNEVVFGALYSPELDEFLGGHLFFYGMPFTVTLFDPKLHPEMMYRPSHLIFRGGGLEKVMRLTWVSGGGSDVVLMTHRSRQ